MSSVADSVPKLANGFPLRQLPKDADVPQGTQGFRQLVAVSTDRSRQGEKPSRLGAPIVLRAGGDEGAESGIPECPYCLVIRIAAGQLMMEDAAEGGAVAVVNRAAEGSSEMVLQRDVCSFGDSFVI